MDTVAPQVSNERRSVLRRAHDRTAERPVAMVRAMDGVRVSWGGVWGGVLVTLALLVLLGALGIAVGISAVDPADPNARSVGVGAAIWTALSLLLALHVGGIVSTRIGATHDRTTSMFEGVLVWIVSVLLMTYLAASGIGMVASGAFKLVGGATQAVGAVVAGGSPDLGEGSVDQIVQRLRDPQTVRTIAAATGTPEEEVQQQLGQIADKAQQAQSNPAQAAAQVRQSVKDMVDRARAEGRIAQAAERAKSAATKTAWVTFAALILSLIAAVLGAMSGRWNAPVTRARRAV